MLVICLLCWYNSLVYMPVVMCIDYNVLSLPMRVVKSMLNPARLGLNGGDRAPRGVRYMIVRTRRRPCLLGASGCERACFDDDLHLRASVGQQLPGQVLDVEWNGFGNHQLSYIVCLPELLYSDLLTGTARCGEREEASERTLFLAETSVNATATTAAGVWDLLLSTVWRVRTAVSRELFRAYRLPLSHCATHQIRVILISSVVISCLLFPAIAIYSSTQTASFSLSFRVFDVLLTPDDLSNYFALDDVRHLWEGHDFLRVRDDSVARARCGKGGIVRLERVLVHHVSAIQDGQSTLDHRTLLSTLKLEHRLSELLAARRSPCIRSPQGRCLVLSPLSFWDHDEDALLRDSDILKTLGPSKNTSAHGLTITADMVLAGRGDGDGSLFGSGDNAYPVLTYFFPESDCLANNGHHFWLNVVEDAAASVDSESIVLTQEPRLLALQVSRANHFSMHELTCYVV